MSSEFPDDWFRQGPAPEQGAGPVDASGADERYTDQFKPGYTGTHPAAAASGTRPAPQAPTGAHPAAAATGTGPAVTTTGTGASHSVGVAPAADPVQPRPRRSGSRVLPLALGTVALLGIGVALGRSLGTHPTTTTTDPQLSAPALASTPASATSTPQATPWTGAVQTVKASSVVASCTAPTQEGYDGNPVPSDAKRVLDGEMATGWRCDGDGQGQTLTFTFPKGTKVVGIRMTNGYTKSVSGTSLYPQYRRLTTVTWSFPALDNAFFLQNLADEHPGLQEIRIPETSADGGMQLQVTTTTSPGSADSTRNAIVVTEVQFLTRKA